MNKHTVWFTTHARYVIAAQFWRNGLHVQHIGDIAPGCAAIDYPIMKQVEYIIRSTRADITKKCLKARAERHRQLR